MNVHVLQRSPLRQSTKNLDSTLYKDIAPVSQKDKSPDDANAEEFRPLVRLKGTRGYIPIILLYQFALTRPYSRRGAPMEPVSKRKSETEVVTSTAYLGIISSHGLWYITLTMHWDTTFDNTSDF
jgi:hypothetical protein